MRRASFRFIPPAPLAGSLFLMLAPAVAGHADDSAAAAPAATITVANCNNSGPGSLRAAVASAASGDRINLASLTCNRIILTSGAIKVAQNDLELVGRNHWSLTIDGNQAGRVFAHSGIGTLRLRRLTIAYGRFEALVVEEVAMGGCIYSDGAVELVGSRVHHCAAVQDLTTLKGNAQGGAVFAQRLVRLSYSRVFASTATIYGLGGGVAGSDIVLDRSQVYGNRVDGRGRGGGVLAYVHAEVVRSLVHDNQATYGGGVYSHGGLTVRKSTVSGNRAVPLDDVLGGDGGGLYMGSPQRHGTIVDSTISGNSASAYSAAFFAGDAAIYNSTIAANEENQDYGIGFCVGEGAVSGEMQLRLESAIVAGNACTFPGPNYDIGAGAVVGSHNLIGTSRRPVPPDTIAADPQLGPLADNGGPTPTHALLSASPAINHGRNPLHLRYDQRGMGFPRVKGARADIGAYER